MNKFYCEIDGEGYKEIYDWNKLNHEASLIENEEEKMNKLEELKNLRLSLKSHMTRNGNGPRTKELLPDEIKKYMYDLEYGTDKDQFGGVRVFLKPLGIYGTLRCPECLAPIRCILD